MIGRLTDEVRQESLWIIMFADDIVICDLEQHPWMEGNLGKKEEVLKVRCGKTECVCE